MRIGVPKEIKTQEFRVGMTPAGVEVRSWREVDRKYWTDR